MQHSVAQLRQNNNCSVYFNLPEKISGVNLVGITEEITDIEIKKHFWHFGWTIYYPKGITDPDFTLLKFTSSHIKSWANANMFEFEKGESVAKKAF